MDKISRTTRYRILKKIKLTGDAPYLKSDTDESSDESDCRQRTLYNPLRIGQRHSVLG